MAWAGRRRGTAGRAGQGRAARRGQRGRQRLPRLRLCAHRWRLPLGDGAGSGRGGREAGGRDSGRDAAAGAPAAAQERSGAGSGGTRVPPAMPLAGSQVRLSAGGRTPPRGPAGAGAGARPRAWRGRGAPRPAPLRCAPPVPVPAGRRERGGAAAAGWGHASSPARAHGAERSGAGLPPPSGNPPGTLPGTGLGRGAGARQPRRPPREAALARSCPLNASNTLWAFFSPSKKARSGVFEQHAARSLPAAADGQRLSLPAHLFAYRGGGRSRCLAGQGGGGLPCNAQGSCHGPSAPALRRAHLDRETLPFFLFR